jgi:hypothetical protein
VVTSHVGCPLSCHQVYGKPLAVTSSIQTQQNLWTLLCLGLQLLATAIVCVTSYQPLTGLLTALEKRGFLKPQDPPTLLKVLRAYCFDPCLWRE